jgi:hypothetical protein
LSATGISDGTFDLDDLLRAERAKTVRGDVVDGDVTATRLTCELSDDADPALASTNWPPVSTSEARVPVARQRFHERRDFR